MEICADIIWRRTWMLVVVLAIFLTPRMQAESKSLGPLDDSDLVMDPRARRAQFASSDPRSNKLLSMVFQNRQELMDYITSRNREVKRQRQCYWSVISCF